MRRKRSRDAGDEGGAGPCQTKRPQQAVLSCRGWMRIDQDHSGSAEGGAGGVFADVREGNGGPGGLLRRKRSRKGQGRAGDMALFGRGGGFGTLFLPNCSGM